MSSSILLGGAEAAGAKCLFKSISSLQGLLPCSHKKTGRCRPRWDCQHTGVRASSVQSTAQGSGPSPSWGDRQAGERFQNRCCKAGEDSAAGTRGKARSSHCGRGGGGTESQRKLRGGSLEAVARL